MAHRQPGDSRRGRLPAPISRCVPIHRPPLPGQSISPVPSSAPLVSRLVLFLELALHSHLQLPSLAASTPLILKGFVSIGAARMPQRSPARATRQEFLRDRNIIRIRVFQILLITTRSKKYIIQIPNLCLFVCIHIYYPHIYTYVDLHKYISERKVSRSNTYLYDMGSTMRLFFPISLNLHEISFKTSSWTTPVLDVHVGVD